MLFLNFSNSWIFFQVWRCFFFSAFDFGEHELKNPTRQNWCLTNRTFTWGWLATRIALEPGKAKCQAAQNAQKLYAASSNVSLWEPVVSIRLLSLSDNKLKGVSSQLSSPW